MSRLSRRALLAAAGSTGLAAFAPPGLRLGAASQDQRQGLWERKGGPHLRGAVFVQRRVYPQLDGPSFLGPGPVGTPVTDAALASLAGAGANLASWSGPGPFSETSPFGVDQAIVDHIGRWLDRCLANGLFTVLCLRTGPGRSAFAFHRGESWYPRALHDESLWREEEKQAAWAAMVDWTIETFSSHPALAGVLAMDEPNSADLGLERVWPRLASRIAEGYRGGPGRAPLLLSPDRWARLEAAPDLRRAAGEGPVLVTHDYAPWSYTHPGDDPAMSFDPAQTIPAPGPELGRAAVLEFGALRDAPNLAAYLRHRISRYEAGGLNWAVFRWTTGWSQYEAVEGRRALSEEPAAITVLRDGFGASAVRPGRF